MIFRTLRFRLLLSHIVPILILLPVMGIAMIYLVESRVLLPQIARELESEARLLAQISTIQYNQWGSQLYYQYVLGRLRPNPDIQVMFLSPKGQILYTSQTDELPLIGYYLQMEGLEAAQSGQAIVFSEYSGLLLPYGEIEVLQPVTAENGNIIGIIRMVYPNAAAVELFQLLRNLMLIILAIGMAAGAILALILAINIGRPVEQVTHAIYDVARGEQSLQLEEHGPQEVRNLVRSINYLVARLNSLEQARRELLANLVHELGRPLGALRSAIHALSSGAANDPQLLSDLTEGMDDETARLQHVLDDLAHLHDQVLGGLEMHREPVALSEWLAKLLVPWQAAAQEKRLHWVAEIPEDLPTIVVDPVRLSQVIGNLLSNAIKYTPAGREVKMEAGTDTGEVFVRIADEGPGIPLEEQERIFVPFYRGEQRRRIKQGMGLGLTIARDLAVAHGGRIELDSAPGAGSKFTLWLPIECDYP
jgi:two-component system, OmpR family, sensor histidine kinase BaeS